MRLDRDVILESAAKTGFRPDTIEKVLRLAPLLSDIAAHPYLGPRLVLKGGTAIQLGLGVPCRLSVDLDFNYTGALDRGVMLAERPAVERELLRLAAARHYRVRPSRQEHAGRKLYLEYRSHAGRLDRVELDVNYLNRQPLADASSRSLWQPPGFPSPTCRIAAEEEVWVGKLTALLGRSLPRDAFDVAMMPERSSHLLVMRGSGPCLSPGPGSWTIRSTPTDEADWSGWTTPWSSASFTRCCPGRRGRQLHSWWSARGWWWGPWWISRARSGSIATGCKRVS